MLENKRNRVLAAVIAGLIGLGALAATVKHEQDEARYGGGGGENRYVQDNAGVGTTGLADVARDDEPLRVGAALVGPATVGPAIVGPAKVGPKRVGPKRVGPRLVGAKRVGPGPTYARHHRGGGGGTWAWKGRIGPKPVRFPPGWTRTESQRPGAVVR